MYKKEAERPKRAADREKFWLFPLRLDELPRAWMGYKDASWKIINRDNYLEELTGE